MRAVSPWRHSGDGRVPRGGHRPPGGPCVSGCSLWQPPAAALDAARAALDLPQTSAYGPDDGHPDLRAKLVEKLRDENGLTRSEVMVTTGANQAFVNVVLSLLDAGDKAVLFKPYYFNGQVVRGYGVFTLFNKVKAKDIYLRVRGYEYAGEHHAKVLTTFKSTMLKASRSGN